MTENKIIEILMKEAHTELSREERRLLDQFRAESSENASFIDDNTEILKHLPSYEGKVVEFDSEQALAKVNKLKNGPAKVVNMNATKPAVQKKTKSFAWLAAAVIILGLGTVVYTLIGNQPNTMVYTTGANTETFLLSDGSEVMLNKQSTLTLSDGFGTQMRAMQLDGEAFFKVKNINNQPFIVQAGEINVEVIGTEFNVKNRSSHEAITVFVTEGKVKVSNIKTRTKVLLTANQSVQYNKNANTLLKDQESQVNATSWFTKQLSFNNISLGNAIEDIESHFNIDIVVDKPSCLSRKYTSLFNDPNQDEVLETMSAVFDFQIIQKGKKSYQLAGGQCE